MLSISERKLALRWYNEGKTQQDIADLVGCHQTSISRLITKFKFQKNVKNILRSGRPTKLNSSTFLKLKTSILKKINSANDQYNNVSTKKIKELIANEIGVVYSIRHVERIMHRLGFNLITPRPQHLRHDQEKVDDFRDEFKKNSKTNIWIMK